MAEWTVTVRIFDDEFAEYIHFDKKSITLSGDASVDELVDSWMRSANLRSDEFEILVAYFDAKYRKVAVASGAKLKPRALYTIDLKRIELLRINVTFRFNVNSCKDPPTFRRRLQLPANSSLHDLVDKCLENVKNLQNFQVIHIKRHVKLTETFCTNFDAKVEEGVEYILELIPKIAPAVSKLEPSFLQKFSRMKVEDRIALHGTVRLGSLYDTKSDLFCEDHPQEFCLERFHRQYSMNVPVECVIGDVEDSLDLLGVKMKQKLSIQSELCPASAYSGFNRAAYIAEENSFVLVCKYISNVIELDMSNVELRRELFANRSLGNATHVVSSVGYGAVLCAIFTPKRTIHKIADVRDAIFRECNNRPLSANAKAILDEFDTNFTVKLYSHPQIQLPPEDDTTIGDALEFVKEIAKNAGEMVAPIFFELTALESVIERKFLKMTNLMGESSQNSKQFEQISRLLGGFTRLLFQLEEVEEVFREFDYSLSGDDKLIFERFESAFREDFEKVLCACQKLVFEMRNMKNVDERYSQERTAEESQLLLDEKCSCLKRYEAKLSSGECDFRWLKAFQKMSNFHSLLRKVEIAKFCLERGVPFVSDIVGLEEEMRHFADVKTYFVFFQRTSQLEAPADIRENMELFEKLLDEGRKCIFYSVTEFELEALVDPSVDLAVEAELQYLTQPNVSIEELEWPNVMFDLQRFVCRQLSTKCAGLIVKFRGEKSLTTDYLSEIKQTRDVSLARCDEMLCAVRPANAIPLQMRCPSSFNVQDGRCADEEHRWQCADCGQHIYYNRDTESSGDEMDHLYCSCGSAPLSQFKFRCRNIREHSDGFVGLDSTRQNILLGEMRGFGRRLLLVLGESGVGKSTWINAIVNYLRHQTLSEAMAAKNLACLIPTIISTTKATDDQPQMIHVEKSDEYSAQNTTAAQHSESLRVGQSQTQNVKAYDIPYKDGTLTVLDNPGTCDTDGPGKDQEHLENTNAFIEANVETIDGVCIVLKPNYERNTAYLLYCINQMMTYLHKNAAKNIIFCFTYSRATLFEPGNTIHFLRRVLEGVNRDGVEVRLTPQNMFYMDNEAFRLLCKVQKGVAYSDEELKQCTKSWENSRRETFRLFKYVEALRPHCSFATLSLNSKRRKMMKLMKPLAEILQLVKTKNTAVCVGEARVAELEDEMAELQPNSAGTRQIIASRPLAHYRTVCIEPNGKCAQMRSDESGKKILYHATVCHERCECVENSVENTYPHPPLQNCSSIIVRNNQFRCNTCDCLWDKHMQIRYEQFEKTVTITDGELAAQLKLKTDEIGDIEKRNFDIIEDVLKLEEEKKQIENVLEKLAAHINQNAIMFFNDAICDYIQMVILEEKGAVDRDTQKIERFTKSLAEYEQQEIIIKNGLVDANATAAQEPDLRAAMKKLFLLPRYGQAIRELLAEEAQRIS